MTFSAFTSFSIPDNRLQPDKLSWAGLGGEDGGGGGGDRKEHEATTQ